MRAFTIAVPDDDGTPEQQQQQTAEPAETPGPVVDLQATAKGEKVIVTWDAPAVGGAPDRYIVHIKNTDTGKGKDRKVAAGKTTTTFGNLLLTRLRTSLEIISYGISSLVLNRLIPTSCELSPRRRYELIADMFQLGCERRDVALDRVPNDVRVAEPVLVGQEVAHRLGRGERQAGVRLRHFGRYCSGGLADDADEPLGGPAHHGVAVELRVAHADDLPRFLTGRQDVGDALSVGAAHTTMASSIMPRWLSLRHDAGTTSTSAPSSSSSSI